MGIVEEVVKKVAVVNVAIPETLSNHNLAGDIVAVCGNPIDLKGKKEITSCAKQKQLVVSKIIGIADAVKYVAVVYVAKPGTLGDNGSSR